MTKMTIYKIQCCLVMYLQYPKCVHRGSNSEKTNFFKVTLCIISSTDAYCQGNISQRVREEAFTRDYT